MFLMWVRNFLEGRLQQVCVNGINSERSNVTSGIPQGSYLALFYLYYISMTCHAKFYLTFSCLQMIQVFRTIASAIDQYFLQADINELAEWSSNWPLSFHADKCKIIHIGNTLVNAHAYKYTMTMPCTINEEKDIGAIVDSKLEYDKRRTALWQ